MTESLPLKAAAMIATLPKKHRGIAEELYQRGRRDGRSAQKTDVIYALGLDGLADHIRDDCADMIESATGCRP